MQVKKQQLVPDIEQQTGSQTGKNSERDGNTRPPDLSLEKPVCRSGRKFEVDMEQQTGFKLGKEYVKAEYCHPAYVTYMQSAS